MIYESDSSGEQEVFYQPPRDYQDFLERQHDLFTAIMKMTGAVAGGDFENFHAAPDPIHELLDSPEAGVDEEAVLEVFGGEEEAEEVLGVLMQELTEVRDARSKLDEGDEEPVRRLVLKRIQELVRLFGEPESFQVTMKYGRARREYAEIEGLVRLVGLEHVDTDLFLQLQNLGIIEPEAE